MAAGAVALYIDNTGKIGTVPSSLRYKNNIKSLNDVDWLYILRPVTFSYKTDPFSITQTRLIAEEVEAVNPDLVSYNRNGEVETVSYTNLVVPMLKAIQDQKKELEENDARIKELEIRLEKIEALLYW